MQSVVMKELDVRNSTKTMISYETWYAFKKELQRRSGLPLLNKVWLQTKPRDSLPWHEDHMKAALARLSSRILRLAICPRCGGNLILDRDIDGYFRRCIQCSFSVGLNVPPSGTNEARDMRVTCH